MASSSLAGAGAGFDLDGAAAPFFLKMATTLVEAAPVGTGAKREAPAKLRGVPIISETPREAGAAAAAREAMAVAVAEGGWGCVRRRWRYLGDETAGGRGPKWWSWWLWRAQGKLGLEVCDWLGILV